MKRLRKYRWPGDVTELQNLIERAVTSAREPVLEIDAALLDDGLPLGHYRLMEKIGEGGMGEVWRARHQLLARPCAIKLIRPELLDQSRREAATERFRLEARSIARLSSPNTVRLYDFGVSETGSFYFVMELLSRHGPRVAGAAFRAAAAGAGVARAASGLPLSRRGPCGRAAPPRHQASQPLSVPARSRFRCREGARLRARQVPRAKAPPSSRRKAR